MNIRKYIRLLTALLFALVLITGCGEEQAAPADAPAGEEEADTPDDNFDPYITGGDISPYYKPPVEEAEIPEDDSADLVPADTDSDTDADLTAAPGRVLSDLFVATYGSDDNKGSFDEPLATIQHALDIVSPGHTIYLMSGVYKGANVFSNSGTDEAPITITNAPGCDPSGIMVSLDYGEEGAIFDMAGQSNIQIINIRIGNSYANWIYGILIPQGSHDIYIEETEFMNMSSPEWGGSYGILMYGDGNTDEAAIRDIYLYDNELHNITAGRGKGIAGSGNINTITVDGNHLYAISNAGIDIYGGDRTCRTNSLDQPYDIILRGNEVHQCVPNDILSCAGILVDGARDTLLEDNYVYECPVGIDVCSENYNYDYPTKNIRVINNTVHDNHDMGISIGGYNSDYHGVVQQIEISENILYNNGYKANDGANGEFHFEKCDGVIVSNNIVRNHDYSYPVIGCGKTSEYVRNVDFINNLYAYDKPEKMIFRFQGNIYLGLEAWNNFTGGSDINAVSSSK